MFKCDIKDIMTGLRAFSYNFVKSFPVLSEGFEIETEMTIHAVDHNMQIENEIIEYRDRPEGSESKLSTYSDGFRVLGTIAKLYKNYKPFGFFGIIALILVAIAAILFFPVFGAYLRTGEVLRFPTLIVSGFLAMGSLMSLFTGLMLSNSAKDSRRQFEMTLNDLEEKKKSKLR